MSLLSMSQTFAFAEQEIDSLLNASHKTSWAYFQDPNKASWYISNARGTTYGLGLNNSGHSAWVTLADGNPIADLDFVNKTVSLSKFSSRSDSFLAISLVGGEETQTVFRNTANLWSSFITEKKVAMDWYFFMVDSTKKWYIVPASSLSFKSVIKRLELNSSQSQYAWQLPRDGSGSGVDVNTDGGNLIKTFFKDPLDGSWRVIFRLPSFSYSTPVYQAPTANRDYCLPQCVTFVKENLGLPGGRLYAKEYWSNPHTGYVNYAQGTSTRGPRPGDILVWSGSLNPNYPKGVCPSTGCGHVAIVKSVNLHEGTLTRVDTNWNGKCAVKETQMTITKGHNGEYTIGGEDSSHLLGWQSKDLHYFN